MSFFFVDGVLAGSASRGGGGGVVGRHRGDGVLASDGERDAELRLGGRGGARRGRRALEDLLRRGGGRERGDDVSVSVFSGSAAAVIDAPDIRGVAVDSLARVDSLGEDEDAVFAVERGGVVHEATAPPHHLRRQRPRCRRRWRGVLFIRRRGQQLGNDEAWRAERPAVAALRPRHGARVGLAAGRGHPPERSRRGRGPAWERARGVAGG